MEKILKDSEQKRIQLSQKQNQFWAKEVETKNQRLTDIRAGFVHSIQSGSYNFNISSLAEAPNVWARETTFQPRNIRKQQSTAPMTPTLDRLEAFSRTRADPVTPLVLKSSAKGPRISNGNFSSSFTPFKAQPVPIKSQKDTENIPPTPTPIIAPLSLPLQGLKTLKTPKSPREKTPRSQEQKTPREKTPRSPREKTPRSQEQKTPRSPREKTPRSQEQKTPRETNKPEAISTPVPLTSQDSEAQLPPTAKRLRGNRIKTANFTDAKNTPSKETQWTKLARKVRSKLTHKDSVKKLPKKKQRDDSPSFESRTESTKSDGKSKSAPHEETESLSLSTSSFEVEEAAAQAQPLKRSREEEVEPEGPPTKRARSSSGLDDDLFAGAADHFEVEEQEEGFFEGHDEQEQLEDDEPEGLFDSDDDEPFRAFSFSNNNVSPLAQQQKALEVPSSRYAGASRSSDGSDVAASRVSDFFGFHDDEHQPHGEAHEVIHVDVEEDLHLRHQERYHEEEEEQRTRRRSDGGDCAKSDPIWTAEAIERLKQERQERQLVANEIRKQQREKRDRERQEQKKQFEERQFEERQYMEALQLELELPVQPVISSDFDLSSSPLSSSVSRDLDRAMMPPPSMFMTPIRSTSRQVMIPEQRYDLSSPNLKRTPTRTPKTPSTPNFDRISSPGSPIAIKAKGCKLPVYDPENSYDSDSEEDPEAIPDWCSKEELKKALEAQSKVDPDTIFNMPVERVCDLQKIFETKTGQKMYPRSTRDSGNWARDKMSTKEMMTYKTTMGWI